MRVMIDQVAYFNFFVEFIKYISSLVDLMLTYHFLYLVCSTFSTICSFTDFVRRVDSTSQGQLVGRRRTRGMSSGNSLVWFPKSPHVP